MSDIEKMLSAYNNQTEKATSGEKEVVADSCCDTCCNWCICCTWFAEGGCC